jgi:hypothetical protein
MKETYSTQINAHPKILQLKNWSSLLRWEPASVIFAWLPIIWSLAAVLTVLVFWGIAISDIDLTKISDIGLFSALPPLFFLAVGLLTVSFGVAVHQQRLPGFILLVHVVALIIIIHGTIPLVYEAPRYSWTYKHIGVTNYIQHFGNVDPYIDVYHNWPSFFALSALFTDLAGFESPLSYAIWSQLFFNLLYLGALLMIYKSLTTDRVLVWLSAWFFVLTNWVGQDYYAPQALAYFFHLIALGLCLTWFRLRTVPTEAEIQRWVLLPSLASRLHRVFSQAATEHGPTASERPGQRMGIMAIIILMLGLIASGHQLTPLMTLVSLTTLVVAQRTSARSLPVLAAIVIAAWNAYVAIWFLGNTAMWLDSLFNPANISDNVSNTSQASVSQFFVIWVARGSSVAVWVLAFLGCLRRLRLGKWDLSAMVLAIIPFPMMVLQSYGGEMIYRIYLFSLPWMVFFNTTLLHPVPKSDSSWRVALMTILVSSIFLGCLHFSYFGQERLNHLSGHELEAAQYIYRTVPYGSLILDATWNFPSKFVRDYNRYNHFSLSEIQETRNKQFPVARLEEVERFMVERMTQDKSLAAYLVISQSQKNHNDLRGLFPPGSIEVLEQAATHSKKFNLIYENPDVKIFRLVKGQRGRGR